MLVLSAIERSSSVKRAVGGALLRVVARVRADKARGPAPAGSGWRTLRTCRVRSLPRWVEGPVALILTQLVFLPVAGQAPDERWRSLESAHFTVTFPEGMEALASKTAARAERAYELLATSLERTPGRTQILLTDHVDVSNGSATVAPYRRVTIFARPPVDGFALSYFDDWLELVLTHELAHVFHLEVGSGLSSILRGVFGSVPLKWPFFPQFTVPEWTVEGLATWYESHLTRQGRVRGSEHDMVLRTAVLEDRFEGIDEASGSSPAWPAGGRSYIYGSLFFEHLLEIHGPERVGEFVRGLGGQWVPYRINAAATRAFGVSFSGAWREWRQEYTAEVRTLARDLSALAPITEPARLTEGARNALYPQISPDGRDLLYAVSDGRSDVQLRVSAPDGTASERLARTNGLAPFCWLPDGSVVFAQLEYADRYHVWNELHRLSADGEVERITEGGRLDHPCATPDGRSAVAVQHGNGTSWLVEVDLVSGLVTRLTEQDPNVHWAFPKVSPDGRWIAASRWVAGRVADVAVLDRRGKLLHEVTKDRALDLAPTWSPDGDWLVWASDRSGIANLVSVPVDRETGETGPLRQVTNLLTGAAFPSVDPAGRWIYFSGYHADGWEIERIPFDPSSWVAPFPEHPRFTNAAMEDRPETAASATPFPAGAYSPLRTVFPHYWSPLVRAPVTAGIGREILGTALGFTTSGEDVVGRHRFEAGAAFTLGTAEMDGLLGYRYAGLGAPLVGVSAGQFWDASGPRVRSDDPERERFWILERERELGASLTWPVPGFRLSANASFGGGLVWESRQLLDDRLEPASGVRVGDPSSRLGDLRASVSLSSTRGHAFSLGPEQGVSLFLRGRTRREMDVVDTLRGRTGADRSFHEGAARLRAFHPFAGPGFSDHVLALQFSAGVAGGPGADAFHFDVGGASGQREPVTGFGLFGGSGYFFPVRGYPNGFRSGRHAWTLALEYRVPLFLVNRGRGLLPLHLDRVVGAFFFDAGNAWGPDLGSGDRAFDNPRRETLASAGVEVSGRLLTFFRIPITLRTGLALPFQADGVELYLRIGRSF